MTFRHKPAYGFAAVILLLASGAHGEAGPILTGSATFGDWTADKPGVTRKISPSDMPAPNTAQSVRVFPRIADEGTDAKPQVPPGFTIAPYGEPLEGPRALAVAPNGDVFVSETLLGRIRVIRPGEGGAAPASVETFAEGLDAPFGVAFYPAANPQWVYVAENNAVKRFGTIGGRGDYTHRIPAYHVLKAQAGMVVNRRHPYHRLLADPLVRLTGLVPAGILGRPQAWVDEVTHEPVAS